MTDYERLTRYMQVGNKVVQVIPQRKERIQAYIDRLFDLEDKIESSELISKKEVERLQNENAELKARLEKAVEFPRIRKSANYARTGKYVVEFIREDDGGVDLDIDLTKEEAEARLKELKEKKQ